MRRASTVGLGDTRSGELRSVLPMMADGSEQIDHMVVEEAIPHMAAITPRAHQVQESQNAELLGHDAR